jgi:antitoxin VapB
VPLCIWNEIVERLARALATRKGTTKTEAVRVALENELHGLEVIPPLRERLGTLQDRALSRAAAGLTADKAFDDALSSET